MSYIKVIDEKTSISRQAIINSLIVSITVNLLSKEFNFPPDCLISEYPRKGFQQVEETLLYASVELDERQHAYIQGAYFAIRETLINLAR